MIARARALAARPAVVVLLAPLLGVLVLRASLFNGIEYRDTWFYAGHGWALEHHVAIFGWYYYAVRFPVVLPIAWFDALLGPVAGYLALRYVVLAATGALVFACVRRFASQRVAAAAVVLLACNPFYMRLVLWDYTTFVGLPATIAAIAVWHLSARRWTALVAGALVCAAAFANPLYAFVAPCLFGVEAVVAARGGAAALREYAARCLAALAGAVLAFAAGYGAYRLYLGDVTPRDLVQPTIDFVRANEERAGPFQVPASVWLRGEPRIYAPLVACLALVLVMGRALLATTLAARLAQVALAYTALVWLYRKLVTSATVEVWWAYSMTAVTICFALPLVLDAAERRWPDGRRLLWPVVGATVAVTLVVRSFDAAAVDAYDAVKDHVSLLVGLLLASVATVVALRVARVRAVAAAGFATSLAVFALAPATIFGIGHTAELSDRPAAEVDAYASARELVRLLDAEDRPAARVLLWSTMRDVAGAISWAALPHVGGGIQDVERPVALPRLTDAEVALLRAPTTRAVLVLADERSAVDGALPALRRRGLRARALRAGTWGGGRVSYELVALR